MAAENPIDWFEPPCRFRIQGTELYTIDLSSYWGNGKCTCKDFECRHGPELKAGRLAVIEKFSIHTWPDDSPLRCKHISRIIDYVGRKLANNMAMEESKKPKSEGEP